MVGRDVEEDGKRGGSFVVVVVVVVVRDGPGVEDEGCWVRSIGGRDDAGGTSGCVVWSALATGRVKTDVSIHLGVYMCFTYSLRKG